MFRLIFGIFSILPWWAYLALSLFLGLAAQGLYEDHKSRVAQAEAAIVTGPPPVVKVGDYTGFIRNTPLNEVHLAGFIRADLGVGRIEGTVPKSYLVLDGANRQGPVVAVMFIGSDNQGGLADLVATANENGLVIVGGFPRTADWSAVSGQLRVQGIRREVLLVEAMVGGRAVALREKGAADLPFVMIVAGLAAAALLMALWRFSRWRKRVRQKSLHQGIVRAKPQNAPPAVPMSQKAATAGVSPWGRFNPVASKPAASPPPPPSGAKPPPTPSKARQPAPKEELVPAIPPFKSVFPGGGSGFRYKTADEIIRETFGTVSRLTVRPPDAK